MRLAQLCCLLFLSFTLFGQTDTFPYARWISDLSIHKDKMNEKFIAVLSAFKNMERSHRRDVLAELRTKAPGQNKRLAIRLNLLEDHLLYYDVVELSINTYEDPTPLMHEALAMAYELDDDWLLFPIYSSLAANYNLGTKYGEAMLYGWLAAELFEKYGPDELFPMATTLYNIALSEYMTADYRASINTASKLLHPHKGYLLPTDTIPSITKMRAWNNLGLAYVKEHQPDSAFIAFDQALVYARTVSPFWVALIDGNKGDVYFQKGMYDSAEIKLKMDFEVSKAAAENDNAANSLQWLARIDLERNKPLDALQKVRDAHRLLNGTYRAEYMARILQTYTKIFIRLGQEDSLNVYLDKYLMLHDSIEQIASDRRAENMLLRLRSTEDILNMKAVNKEQEKVALIRNFMLIVISLSALVGFFILNRQKIVLRFRRQEAVDAKRLAEQETRQAKEQLNLYTRNLLEKNQLVETLQEQLLDRELSEEHQAHITQLSRHTILTDEDWKNFKTLFEKVYPGFFYSLKQKISDLTPAEQRMAAMSRLHVSNKQAAALLGIAPNSVIKAKQRLRHRLGLEPEADLESYFSQTKDF